MKMKHTSCEIMVHKYALDPRGMPHCQYTIADCKQDRSFNTFKSVGFRVIFPWLYFYQKKLLIFLCLRNNAQNESPAKWNFFKFYFQLNLSLKLILPRGTEWNHLKLHE